jgi:heat shock protein HslJ
MKILGLSLLIIIALASFTAARTSAQAGDPLAGSEWVLVSYGAVDAPTQVIEGSGVTLNFGADNRVSGYAGCNGFNSTYAVDGSALSFAAIASTRRACVDAALTAQENAYLSALRDAQAFVLEDRRLTLEYGDGQRLVFRRAPAVIGSEWRLVSYGAADAQTPVVEGSMVTLRLSAEGNAVGSGGCNMFTGSYTLSGSSLSIGDLARTLRACLDDAVMTQEDTVLAALGAATGYTVSERQLIISYGESEQLVYQRIIELVGPEWQLVSFGVRGAETPVVATSTVTLRFTEDGNVGGSGGCNSYGGRYSVDGEALTIDRLVSTMMACEQDGIGAQELAFFAALGTATGYTLVDDQLTIAYGGDSQLIFTLVNSS